MAASTSRHYTLFLGTPALAGVITAPTCGGSVTNAAITVTWSGVSGVQLSFTVQVFSDAALTTLVYYSGVVASAVSSHVIPAGPLSNGATYYLLVDWVETDGQTGETATPCSFATNFAPGGAVAGLVVTTHGGCGSLADELPSHALRWTQIVPGVGETFVAYHVKRRERSLTALWMRIATITAVATVTYTDYNVRSGAVYEYAIVWEATKAGASLISSEPALAKRGLVAFDFMWIHEVGNAALYNLRFDQWEARITLNQDAVKVETWGAQAPRYQFGELQYHEASIPGRDRRAGDLAHWQRIRDMITRQRNPGAIYCVRLGRAQELWFANLTGPQRDVGQGSYSPSLQVCEIDYSEAI